MKNLLKMSDLSPAELTHILDVADQLKEQDIIDYPWLFRLFVGLTNKKDAMRPGIYVLDTTMDYSAIVRNLSAKSSSKAEVTVVIQEGVTGDLAGDGAAVCLEDDAVRGGEAQVFRVRHGAGDDADFGRHAAQETVAVAAVGVDHGHGTQRAGGGEPSPADERFPQQVAGLSGRAGTRPAHPVEHRAGGGRRKKCRLRLTSRRSLSKLPLLPSVGL